LIIYVLRFTCIGIGLVYNGLWAIVIPWCCAILVSAAAAIAFCLLGILGNGDLLVYPFLSVPTHPLGVLGLSARRSSRGEYSV